MQLICISLTTSLHTCVNFDIVVICVICASEQDIRDAKNNKCLHKEPPVFRIRKKSHGSQAVRF